MRIKVGIIVLFWIATICFVSGCSSGITTITQAAIPTNTFTNNPTTITSAVSPSSDQPILKFRRVIWNPGAIYLFGYANVPDQTRLYIQLFQNGQPAEWYKNYLEAYVTGGRWQVSVKAAQWMSPDQIPDFEAGYTFRIWDPTNPQIDTTFALPFPAPQVTITTDLKDSQWKLVSLGGKALIAGSTIDAYFDTKNKGAIWGNSNPNFYGGKYETDTPNSLIIYDMTETLLGGPDNLMRQESDYLRYLQDVVSFKIVNNQLEIYDDLQTRTLVFDRLP